MDKKNIDQENQIRILQELLDEKDRELFKLRHVAELISSLDDKRKELDSLIKKYKDLCKEAENHRDEYKQHNREMISLMNEYRAEINTFFDDMK